MTFADLLTALEAQGVLPLPAGPRTARPRCAILLLPSATALWDACPVDAACRQKATWAQRAGGPFRHARGAGQDHQRGDTAQHAQ